MKLLILVVDDEPDVELLFRQQFRRDLREGRFAMEFAQSAQEALQRITECDTDTSLFLILSDINMPGMSGLDLLPKAKAVRPDVPVIMIAAYDDAETRRKALASGADAFLTKPIDLRLSGTKLICASDTPHEAALQQGGLCRGLLRVIDGCDDGLCATDGMPLTADAPLQRGELAKSAISGLPRCDKNSRRDRSCGRYRRSSDARTTGLWPSVLMQIKAELQGFF